MTLTVNGSATVANVNSITMPTCVLNDVILLFIAGETSNHPTLVTDTALLTWTGVGSVQVANGAGFNTVGDLYYAVSNGTLTGETIAVTRTGLNGRLMVMTVSGANSTTPLDSNASNPKTATISASTPLTISGLTTNNANTMLIAWCRGDQTGQILSSTPSGYTQVLSGGSFTGLYYKVVSATQSSVSAAYGFAGNTNAVGIFVAVQAPGGGVSSNSNFLQFMSIG